MNKILQDIWIMNETGLVLYSRVFDEKISDQLFGGLMSALYSFAEEITKECISSFELSKKRYIIFRSNGLFFIGNSDKSKKEKKLEDAIQKVAERFHTKYDIKISKQWAGDITIFKDFEEDIEEALQDPIKGFWDDF